MTTYFEGGLHGPEAHVHRLTAIDTAIYRWSRGNAKDGLLAHFAKHVARNARTLKAISWQLLDCNDNILKEGVVKR